MQRMHKYVYIWNRYSDDGFVRKMFGYNIDGKQFLTHCACNKVGQSVENCQVSLDFGLMKLCGKPWEYFAICGLPSLAFLRKKSKWRKRMRVIKKFIMLGTFEKPIFFKVPKFFRSFSNRFQMSDFFRIFYIVLCFSILLPIRKQNGGWVCGSTFKQCTVTIFEACISLT